MTIALYTTSHRWNLSDVHIEYNSGGINITGYGPLANVPREAPFKPENIVILTDGYCASTCTIFSELMTKQAGVKTVVLGGRTNTEPIQAIGGVKGTNNFQYAFIEAQVEQAIEYAEGDLEFQKKLTESLKKPLIRLTAKKPGSCTLRFRKLSATKFRCCRSGIRQTWLFQTKESEM